MIVARAGAIVSFQRHIIPTTEKPGQPHNEDPRHAFKLHNNKLTNRQRQHKEAGQTFSCVCESRRVCEVIHLTTLDISSTRRAHETSRSRFLCVGSPDGSQPSVMRTTGTSKSSVA